jgi:hypothetical protein
MPVSADRGPGFKFLQKINGKQTGFRAFTHYDRLRTWPPPLFRRRASAARAQPRKPLPSVRVIWGGLNEGGQAVKPLSLGSAGMPHWIKKSMTEARVNDVMGMLGTKICPL